MSRVHFLNVNDGDCTIVQHETGRNTVIDVSAAKKPARLVTSAAKQLSVLEAMIASFSDRSKSAGVSGNFNRSEYPDDPVAYMLERNLTSVFRFISTHADMDHLDGIVPFFHVFSPNNFWDTSNNKEMTDFDDGRYDPEDWAFYKALRDGNPQHDPKRMVLYSGNTGNFWTDDGLQILAPTPALVLAGNREQDWNDSSYVILYYVGDKRVLFCGDSHDRTWAHILTYWRDAVTGVDLMIAPHHGRDSDRDHRFLDIVRPKLTLFGNAPSEHLAYSEWNDRELMFITNNQAGTIIIDFVGNGVFMDVYVSHKPFAEAFTEQRGYETSYSEDVRGWFIGRRK